MEIWHFALSVLSWNTSKLAKRSDRWGWLSSSPGLSKCSWVWPWSPWSCVCPPLPWSWVCGGGGADEDRLFINWTVDMMIWGDEITAMIQVIYTLDSSFVVAVSRSFITTSSESVAGAGGLQKNASIFPGVSVLFGLLVFFGSRIGYESSGSLRTSGVLL